jgi:hypothetical protein
VVTVLERRHANPRRLAQSKPANKYTKPRGIGLEVISAAQTWFGRVLSAWRRREGETVWAGCRWLVRGVRYTASMPMRLIRVARCRRPLT